MWKFNQARRFFSFDALVLSILKRFDRFQPEKYSANAPTSTFGLDSLDTVEFVIALEDQLKIELNDEEALKIDSVEAALATFGKYQKINP